MIKKEPSKASSDVPSDEDKLPPVDIHQRSVEEPMAEEKVVDPGANAADRNAARLERQVRFFKRVTAFLFIVLAGLAGTFVYLRHMNRPVQIIIDGKTVATAKNYQAGVALLEQAEKAAAGDAYPSDSFVRMQHVEFVRTSGDAAIDSDASIRQILARDLKLKVRAYVIKVDGRPTVGVPTSQAATQALAMVKEHYASMPPNADIVEQPKFLERVVIDRASVPESTAKRNADEAAHYFWALAPPNTYVVKPGDRGYKIAVSHHVSFPAFLAANAGKDMNKLQPGDVVNLSQSKPLLSVVVKKKLTATEPILADEDPDRAGKRRVVYAVTYTNGHETRRDVLSMVTLSRPEPRMRL